VRVMKRRGNSATCGTQPKVSIGTYGRQVKLTYQTRGENRWSCA